MSTCVLCNNYLSREWALSLQHLTNDVWDHKHPPTPSFQLAWLDSVRALLYNSTTNHARFSTTGNYRDEEVYDRCGSALLEIQDPPSRYLCYGSKVGPSGNGEVCFP